MRRALPLTAIAAASALGLAGCGSEQEATAGPNADACAAFAKDHDELIDALEATAQEDSEPNDGQGSSALDAERSLMSTIDAANDRVDDYDLLEVLESVDTSMTYMMPGSATARDGFLDALSEIRAYCSDEYDSPRPSS